MKKLSLGSLIKNVVVEKKLDKNRSLFDSASNEERRNNFLNKNQKHDKAVTKEHNSGKHWSDLKIMVKGGALKDRLQSGGNEKYQMLLLGGDEEIEKQLDKYKEEGATIKDPQKLKNVIKKYKLYKKKNPNSSERTDFEIATLPKIKFEIEKKYNNKLRNSFKECNPDDFTPTNIDNVCYRVGDGNGTYYDRWLAASQYESENPENRHLGNTYYLN